MVQLCPHYREDRVSPGFGSAHCFQPHSLSLKLAGHVWLNWRLLRHTDTSVISWYATQWPIWPIASSNSSYQGSPWPKRIVSAQAWHNWGNYDIGWWYEARSNPVWWFELVCIATSVSLVNMSWCVNFYLSILLVGHELYPWGKPNCLRSWGNHCAKHWLTLISWCCNYWSKRNARCWCSSSICCNGMVSPK